MAQAKFKGNPVNTSGNLPAPGSSAPDFTLVASDLSEKRLSDFAGKKLVLSINHSFDTGTCQATARAFNKSLGGRSDVAVLMISADLPFAQKRFCESEGLSNILPLSTYRSSFGKDYGVELVDSPIKGLTARSIVVVNPDGKVADSFIVPEITAEPDYDRVHAALK